MKNKNIANISLIMIIIIILVIINFLRYNSVIFNESILKKNWYRYDYNNGLYEKIYLENNKVSYYKPSKMNEENIFDYCKEYVYDKQTKLFNLDCKRSIKITSKSKNSILVDVDDKNYIFFDNIDDSLNYEFEKYFEKSMVDYKKEKAQVTEFSNINEDKLLEVLKEDEYSKIVFIGKKCTSVDCVLALDIMEKWISMSENIYYYDVDSLSDKVISYINKMDKTINNSKEYYDNIYPIVLITKNDKIVDKYEIKCDGFNCSKYYKNEF